MIPLVLTFSLMWSVLSQACLSIGPKGTLTIENKIVSPDGFERFSVVAQGIHPGPLIKAKKGDKFRVNVVNLLTDDTMQRGTSIHWHGILQDHSSWADGPAGVTQCPIAQNSSFVYEFTPKDQTGTFWYHSHFGTQYCDGLRGPLVIYDPNDPHKSLYDVDDESTIITLSDWYHTPSPSVGRIAIANSTLINGLGRYIGGPLSPLSVINVDFGRRYRFRLISTSCDPNHTFSIDGHSLTIIEADGGLTSPVTVDAIQIFAGQRYSFVLHANQTIGNYWIRALPSSGANNLSGGFVNATNSAILRYKGASTIDPNSTQQALTLLRETDLQPLFNPSAPGLPYPGGADINLNLELGLGPYGFTINNRNFSDLPVPVLLQILSGANTAQDLLPAGDVYVLPSNKVVEISIPAGIPGGPHPFHLHGHSFSVVKSAGIDSQVNYVNPIRRDVVSIGDAGSNVTIRFVTDNPGPWILHCHIDFHLIAGLGLVFAEDPQEINRTSRPPESWDKLCPIYNRLPPSETSVRIVPLVSFRIIWAAMPHLPPEDPSFKFYLTPGVILIGGPGIAFSIMYIYQTLRNAWAMGTDLSRS